MYIFLDVDGVLNKKSDWKTPYCLNMENIDNFKTFLKTLKNPKIVLTSSWRKGFVRQYNYCTVQIQNLLDKLAPYEIYGRTKELEEGRLAEIKDYLDNHEKDSYLILDDDITEYPNKNVNGLLIVDNLSGFSKKDIKSVKKYIVK